MGNSGILKRFVDLANEYIFAAKLLLDSMEHNNIDPNSHNDTRPLFHLIAHSYECILKALYIEKEDCSERELKNLRHDLNNITCLLEDALSEDLKELGFYISSSHFNYDGVKSSYPLRYNDNRFDCKEEKTRRIALLDKQKTFGYSSDTAILIGAASEQQLQELSPELEDYSSYLRAHTLMRPYPEFAITAIRFEIRRLYKKLGDGRLSLTRDEWLDDLVKQSNSSDEAAAL